MSQTTSPSGDAKRLEVRCPSCGEKHLYSLDNPYRPFCSKGCKGIDLGAWASEAFRLPERESSSTPDFEQG